MTELHRPADGNYYVSPWSETFLQGDVFRNVPIAFPAPPDAVVLATDGRRFVSGPFDAGPAILVTPSCVKESPARTLVPIRSIDELVATGALAPDDVDDLRSDRLRNYLYLPAGDEWLEGAGVLHLPVTMHEDVIADGRVAQLTGEAHRRLRVKLMAFSGGFLLDPAALGDVPEQRTH